MICGRVLWKQGHARQSGEVSQMRRRRPGEEIVYSGEMAGYRRNLWMKPHLGWECCDRSPREVAEG